MKFLALAAITLLKTLQAQEIHHFEGRLVSLKGQPVVYASVGLLGTQYSASSDQHGKFVIKGVPAGQYTLTVLSAEYQVFRKEIGVPGANTTYSLQPLLGTLEEVVVTGTLKETGKDESPISIDIITPKLFQKSATPNLFEATSLVNGVKPQINCNVCNTGDIHINGMEGPYTLVLIDGMPIVSGLSSVYGLMGIPASMIGRLEIAKGPAGALYGSEAMGGTINVITRNPALAPRLYMDYYTTSYLENNFDLGLRSRLGKKVIYMGGLNGYLFDHKTDINKDNFTDVTLQKRISLFSKILIQRKNEKEFSIAARYVGEDRWGGEMNWTKAFRGGDSVYGESIYANRGEFISKYQ
jgi:outer membrane receptor for ferrienterochelin and colicins